MGRKTIYQCHACDGKTSHARPVADKTLCNICHTYLYNYGFVQVGNQLLVDRGPYSDHPDSTHKVELIDYPIDDVMSTIHRYSTTTYPNGVGSVYISIDSSQFRSMAQALILLITNKP